jgi:uncharacterized protein YggE
MLKSFVLASLLLVAINLRSQTNTSNEIVSEGGAKMKVNPDLATFRLTVEKTDSAEKAAIMSLNKMIDGLIHSLNSVGFKNENIKIADYDISSSYNDKDKKTYTASNTLNVVFRIDNKLIDAFYAEIQRAAVEDLEVSFDTRLSDSLEKAMRLKLMQQAIEDARINATTISQTLGIHISKVKQVHKYSENVLGTLEMVKFTPTVLKRDTDDKYNTAFDKFQVDDIELEERVTVVYEIAKQ